MADYICWNNRVIHYFFKLGKEKKIVSTRGFFTSWEPKIKFLLVFFFFSSLSEIIARIAIYSL